MCKQRLRFRFWFSKCYDVFDLSPDFPNVFVYWQVFDSSGSFLSFVNTAADPLYGPQGLAVTSDGYVAVADSGNHCFKIYKYLQWNPLPSLLTEENPFICCLMKKLCAIALLLFLVQPSRKCNLQCLYDLNCICLSEVQLYLLLFTLYGDVYVLTTSMNGYPDVTHL